MYVVDTFGTEYVVPEASNVPELAALYQLNVDPVGVFAVNVATPPIQTEFTTAVGANGIGYTIIVFVTAGKAPQH